MKANRSLVICLVAALLSAPSRTSAQTMWSEAWVGSEWETYVRALTVRGLLPSDAWSIRPFSAALVEKWATAIPEEHPWRRRLPRRDTPAPERSWEILRPSVSTSLNSDFAWGYHDAAVWQGRGLNTWATAGIAVRRFGISARVEPLIQYASNRPFALTAVPPASPNLYLDPMRSGGIDLPQRFGDRPLRLFSMGQSRMRYEAGGFAATLGTENLFWGPAYRNPVILGYSGAGFPHLAVGTSRALSTRLGRFHGQLLYGRLGESSWAPVSQADARLGSGLIAMWMPPRAPVEIGIMRFFHTEWPKRFGVNSLLIPFNVLVGHDPLQQAGETISGKTTNEMASVFFAVRAPRSGLEVFGEFARNDRPEDLRDLVVELEHNSAWSLGVLAAWPREPERSFWTLRLEYLNARIASIQRIGREQSTFYDHSPWTQGHTVQGQLLGSPLMERSGGAEAALDRWTPFGRVGLLLIERQMPEDGLEGMRDAAARTQWDLGATALIFIGSGDLSVGAGRVLDVNRFPGRHGRNTYLRVGWRMATQ